MEADKPQGFFALRTYIADKAYTTASKSMDRRVWNAIIGTEIMLTFLIIGVIISCIIFVVTLLQGKTLAAAGAAFMEFFLFSAEPLFTMIEKITELLT